MSKYIYQIYLSFKSNFVYRFDLIISIINTILQIFIYCLIWKALYQFQENVDGISYSMVVTNFVIGLALINSYNISDFEIQNKLKDGTIGNELLKPASYKWMILSKNLGNIFFKLLVNFLPAIIISIIFLPIAPPVNITAFLLFLFSLILGFLVYFSISLIIQMTAFWIFNVWSMSTIKNVFVNLLSGSLIPIWFMPNSLVSILQYTPFYSIYFLPLNIYLGKVANTEILSGFMMQIFWIILLSFIGSLMWNSGRKRLVVQGG